MTTFSAHTFEVGHAYTFMYDGKERLVHVECKGKDWIRGYDSIIGDYRTYSLELCDSIPEEVEVAH